MSKSRRLLPVILLTPFIIGCNNLILLGVDASMIRIRHHSEDDFTRIREFFTGEFTEINLFSDQRIKEKGFTSTFLLGQKTILFKTLKS